MTDKFSPEQRSRIMSHIKGQDSAVEIKVRAILHRMGYRFRLHRRDLPGRPDIVLPGLRKVIFVHGCFWHGHKRCRRASIPKTNEEFWRQKLHSNCLRDKRVCRSLRSSGWDVLIVWQCQVRNAAQLERRLCNFLSLSKTLGSL
jgi:DNA mismatch endonuclease, patch repair protein